MLCVLVCLADARRPSLLVIAGLLFWKPVAFIYPLIQRHFLVCHFVSCFGSRLLVVHGNHRLCDSLVGKLKSLYVPSPTEVFVCIKNSK